jgi:hypothetical protein
MMASERLERIKKRSPAVLRARQAASRRLKHHLRMRCALNRVVGLRYDP